MHHRRGPVHVTYVMCDHQETLSEVALQPVKSLYAPRRADDLLTCLKGGFRKRQAQARCRPRDDPRPAFPISVHVPDGRGSSALKVKQLNRVNLT